MFNLIVANMYKHHLIELRLFSKRLCSGTVMLVTHVDDKIMGHIRLVKFDSDSATDLSVLRSC